jgi:excinuclease UvrABC nuclease subunit
MPRQHRFILYRHFDADDNLLYVGKSCRLRDRIGEHASQAHWFDDIKWIQLEHFPDKQSLHIAELMAIGTEKPCYNIQCNDDRSQSPFGPAPTTIMARKRRKRQVLALYTGEPVKLGRPRKDEPDLDAQIAAVLANCKS